VQVEEEEISKLACSVKTNRQPNRITDFIIQINLYNKIREYD
jgi:hypothetical protein